MASDVPHQQPAAPHLPTLIHPLSHLLQAPTDPLHLTIPLLHRPPQPASPTSHGCLPRCVFFCGGGFLLGGTLGLYCVMKIFYIYKIYWYLSLSISLIRMSLLYLFISTYYTLNFSFLQSHKSIFHPLLFYFYPTIPISNHHPAIHPTIIHQNHATHPPTHPFHPTRIFTTRRLPLCHARLLQPPKHPFHVRQQTSHASSLQPHGRAGQQHHRQQQQQQPPSSGHWSGFLLAFIYLI